MQPPPPPPLMLMRTVTLLSMYPIASYTFYIDDDQLRHLIVAKNVHISIRIINIFHLFTIIIIIRFVDFWAAY